MRDKENIIKTLKVMIDSLKKADKIDYAEIRITPEMKEPDTIGVVLI